MMKRLILSTLPALGAMTLFTSCAGIPGESPEHMQKRLDRQDTALDRYNEKRQMRIQASDRRYERSWDRAMGHETKPLDQY